jgi:L-threonylcarbamoyladenylate synthase
MAAAAGILRGGGLAIYPTETFYALGALWSHTAALRRLATAKGRADGKPLPLVAASLAQVEEVASLADPLARRLAERFWPGPLTLVLPARPAVPVPVSAGTGTAGVRVAGSALARALAQAAGGALVTTSANPSGAPPPVRAADLDPALVSSVDAVLDAGPAPGGLPSTVVEVTGGGPRLVRAGGISWEAVLDALR